MKGPLAEVVKRIREVETVVKLSVWKKDRTEAELFIRCRQLIQFPER